MAYVKTVWQNGDIILPEKLNNMEDGIEANDQKQAVLYSAQTLTDAQKAQARENIGVNGGGVSFDDLFPVGAFWWSTVAGSPAAQGLSAGTWEQIKDTFLLAAGDSYTSGETGGSPDAVVVSHQHYLQYSTDNGVSWTNARMGKDGAATGTNYLGVANSVGLFADYQVQISSQGTNGAGKNMPPYLTAYCWHRVA